MLPCAQTSLLASLRLALDDQGCINWMTRKGSLRMELGNVGSIARGLKSHPDEIPVASFRSEVKSYHDFELLVPDGFLIVCASPECRKPMPLVGATSVRKPGTGQEIHEGLLCTGCAVTLGDAWNLSNRSVYGTHNAHVPSRWRFWFFEIRKRALGSIALGMWRASVIAGKRRRAAIRVTVLTRDMTVGSSLPDLPLLVTELIAALSISLPRPVGACSGVNLDVPLHVAEQSRASARRQ